MSARCLRLLLALALLALHSLSLAASLFARDVIDLDPEWQFATGEQTGAEEIEFDDAAWQQVDLPHDWAIAGPFAEDAPARGEGGFLPTGVCWYRKAFQLPASLNSKRVFVEFDGVMANSDVWINGHKLGHRPFGYVSFRYDLTDHLKSAEGEENVLVVRADTSAQVASRWYTGTGIYRHVRLVAVDPLHVAFQNYGGVFVTTPEISKEKAKVNVQLAVRNHYAAPKSANVHTAIHSSAGEVVAETESTESFDPEELAQLQVSLDVESPELWNLDDPSLYTVVNTITLDGGVADSVTTTFGIRDAKFDADSGFWLNGKNFKIKGVCLHHCGGAVGAAVPLSVWEPRLNELRKLGTNAVRTAHNPVAPEFLDLCDRMGFLVMDEFFDCWTVGKRKHDYHLYFKEWAHRDMRDTMLRDRNHPSVILWSVGNEIHDTPREELAKRILKGLVEVCHETDPTRPVTQALFRPNVSHDYDNGLADMLDVIGTNYRDLELLQAWRDNPKRKIIGTEQGHDRKIWLACRDHAQHSGQFLWCGIDYLGESRRWPVTTFNSGLLDRTAHPHPRGYERQSWWSDQPVVHVFRRIAATEETPTDPGYEAVEWRRRQVLFDDWTPRNTEPHTERVEVVSNCDEVELLVNGESLGSKPLPENATPRVWEVQFSPGTLIAVGKNDGQEIARHELRTAGEAHHIELTTNRDSLPVDWDEVAQLEARLVDAEGTLVPRAQHEIVFHVSGPGKVIAVDNGSIVSHEPFTADRRQAFQGRCVAVLRATAADSPITVTAEAAGLEAATAALNNSN